MDTYTHTHTHTHTQLTNSGVTMNRCTHDTIFFAEIVNNLSFKVECL